MLLKSLELQGFKTFPEKTKLTFDEGFTAVVGPNGSGKSNISDAMRWVLGEQSVKALRCSKMEDVIFNGTAQRRAMSCAEVTLTIDNSDRRLPFDGDTVTVTRRFYRSGDSDYLINKAAVRLKDIHELFMDTGLGRDGYSMIGQGRIDAIVAARSEDRREIFEEAAGVSRFRYRKEEAERRLQHAQDNLVRLHDILGELEGRIGPLREQAEKAGQFLEYSRERKELEISVSLAALDKSDGALREQEQKIAAAQAQLDAVQHDLQELAQESEALFAQTNRLTAAMDEQRGAAAADEEAAVRTQGEIGVLETNIAHNRDTIARIEREMEQASLSAQELEKQLEQTQAALGDKDAACDALNARLRELSGRVEELRQQLAAGTQDAQTLTEALSAENAAMAELRVALSAAKTSAQEIDRQQAALQHDRQAAQERAEELEKTGRETQAFADDLQKQIAAAENGMQGLKMLLNRRQERVEKRRKALDELRLDVGGLDRRVGILEDMEKSLEGFSQSVKTVLREAQRGTLQGVHGPISRLITVPGKYALAIETALGAAMQNIVVDSDRDAKNAIRLLQRNDAGRATFLPLNIIRGTEIDEPALNDCPGFVGVASTVCACDERYRAVLRSLLGRVLLAEDLDAAGAIARRFQYRWRVVTLDGQVINSGGSFTGGSSGRQAGVLSRAAEIERLREERRAMLQKQSEAEVALKNAQEEAARLNAQWDLARAEQEQLQADLRRAEEELGRNRLEAQLNAGTLRDLAAQNDAAENRRAALEEENRQTLAQMEACRGRIETIQVRLAAAGDANRQLDEKNAALGEQLQELRLSCFAAATEKENLRRALDELRRRQQDGVSRTATLRQEREDIQRSNETIAGQMDDLRRKAGELQASAADRRAQVERLAQQRSDCEQRATALRGRERELSADRETANLALARLQERQETLQRDYDAVVTRLWEEYELTRRQAQEIAEPARDLPKANRRLNELRGKIRALGSVNVAAVDEYREVSERYAFLKEQIDDAEHSRNELLQLINRLTRQMRELFVERFSEIRAQFSLIFRELFGGGSADITIADENDVLNSGIDIEVHPPGKIVTHMEALSGGEKALVAIAIYFAIMKVSPPPFCMLDEIEAALDDVNVNRFAAFLHRMSDRTQFIVVTHRRGTMEVADALYGVTMQDQGISQLLELRHDETDGMAQ